MTEQTIAEPSAVQGEAQPTPAEAPAPAASASTPAPSADGTQAPRRESVGGEGTTAQEAKTEAAPEAEPDLMGSEPEAEAADKGVLGAPEGGYKFEPSPESGMHFDEGTLERFGEAAKELNLSQESAQKLLNRLEPIVQSNVQKLRSDWIKASRQDEEFGGAAFEKNMKAVNRAYVATTSPALREVLKASGLVNHPEVIRHFYGLSKVLGDGKYITSQGASEREDRGSLTGFYKGMNP